MEVGAEKQMRGKTNPRTLGVFLDLLIFVSHHRQRNVLSHVVQLIGEAVGAGNVDGGAVIVILPDCKETHISYTTRLDEQFKKNKQTFKSNFTKVVLKTV